MKLFAGLAGEARLRFFFPFMLETFFPEKFCREFVSVKGHSSQLTMIMATVKGIKPCMDDWVRMDRYAAYKTACRRYGLYVMPDAVFDVVRRHEVPSYVIGKERLTTTIAYGRPFKKTARDGFVHVFISKTKTGLATAFADGWYPLIIKNRLIDKPLMDAFRFGHGLGYPRCCIGFFQKYNNWVRYSHLYEIYRNTPKNAYHYLCNPFTKDTSYSYIYHMPCSYHCRETVKSAKRIQAVVRKEEPAFAEKIDKYLKRPLLVFYERKFYAFEGECKKNRIRYRDVFFLGQMPENNHYENDLKKGDCVFLEKKDVVILKRGKLIKKILWKKRNFAPETPFLIQFYDHVY